MDKKWLASPLDLQRNGRLNRAKALGLTPTLHSSFESNQSFPRLSRKFKSSLSKAPLVKGGLLNPEGLDSISFSTQATMNSIHTDMLSDFSECEPSCVNEDSTFNPNPYKGVLTVDAKTTQILITNTIICKMLGYSNEELTHMKLTELIIKEKNDQALPDMLFQDNGDIIVYNGKVVELKCKDGLKMAVSMWLTHAGEQEGNNMFVAVIEPVQRVISHLLLDEYGTILTADDTALSLFHTTDKDFVGHNIIKFIPNIHWPVAGDPLDHQMRIQRTTGSNQSSQSFPLTLRLDYYEGESNISLSNSTVILPFCQATIWVFTNMSGMVLIDGTGTIIDCNSIFSQLALGYSREQLIGTNLSEILMDFTEPHYGRYHSNIRHQNGSLITVSYFVNEALGGILNVYQIWMAVSTAPVCDNLSFTLDLTRSRNHGNQSRVKEVLKRSEPETARGSKDSSTFDDEMFSGDYSERYQVIKQIGSGGFGCVQLAVNQADNKVVVTKFIKKSRVYPESWIDTDDGRVPYEIYFLRQIRHANIVSMVDCFENSLYFQLVMEKHGFGMDLFEFIERSNGVLEPLGAYIFKQVISAVEYLHTCGILHRDIKDENIVIDDRFHAKLIDFGSAAPLSGQLYSNFCGTFEYCSPEVLKGSPYRGPELEVWAMGVTLYVLVFGRSPFSGIEEILREPLDYPSDASDELRDLLNRMMDRDVQARCSVEDVAKHAWINQEVHIEDYDFYGICDLTQSNVEFQQSRYLVEDAPALATSTPYKRALPFSKKDSVSTSLFELKDESIHFQVPELVFQDASASILSEN